jgi:hypothetical protein
MTAPFLFIRWKLFSKTTGSLHSGLIDRQQIACQTEIFLLSGFLY